jgi:hypothetical protein
MNEVADMLNLFESISLSEMDGVKLMNRTDKKFVFRFGRLDSLLEMLQAHYRILEVEGVRMSRYESLYFDTESYMLYHQHHCGKANRYKVRCRKYVESNLNFFEVKFKNNKGRTIKDRVKQKQITGTIIDKAELLLNQKTSLQSQTLQPKLWVNYTRITLVSKTQPERVTIDLNLTFKDHTTEKTLPYLVIAEVKQDKAEPSPFIQTMRQLRIREGSISKYCFGVISLNEHIKHNNFKLQIRHLNNIGHGSAIHF